MTILDRPVADWHRAACPLRARDRGPHIRLDGHRSVTIDGDHGCAEVVLLLGQDRWRSPGGRPPVAAIAADPARAMIVIDPRRTAAAELADFHLRVEPGTDAWCLAAMLAVLVDDDLLDHDFLAEHADGLDEVLAALRGIPVPEYARACGIDWTLIRSAAHRFAAAASATTHEAPGIPRPPDGTLVAYLTKLLWLLTGNFGRPGTMYLRSPLGCDRADVWAYVGGRRFALAVPELLDELRELADAPYS